MADIVGAQRGPSINEMRQAPDSSVLAQRGSAFASVEQQADQSLRESAPEDLSSVPQGQRSKLEDALKACLAQGLNSAATAAANSGRAATAFGREANRCLQGELSGLSPTPGAVRELVVYLAGAVGGAVTEPQARNATPAGNGAASRPIEPAPAQSAPGADSSFPWWIVALGIVALLAVGGAISRRHHAIPGY